MAVQLNIESLTKSHQFIWEACKILWQHKKIFFAFAVVPMVLDVVENVLSDKEFIAFQYEKARDDYSNVGQYLPNNEGWPKKQIFESFYMNLSYLVFILKVLISLPILVIAWFQYLLNSNYQISIKSYLKLDFKVIKFLSIFSVYFLFILIWPYLLYACAMIPSLILFYALNFDFLKTIFNFPACDKILKELDIFTLWVPLIGTPLAIGFWVFLYRFLHILFILPSVALDKALDRSQAHQNIAPYCSSVFISLLLFLIASSICFMPSYEIIHKLLQPHGPITEVRLIVMSIVIYTGIAFKNYLILGLSLTFVSLYYKKCVIDK